MEKHIGDVVPVRIHAIQLEIQGMREPSQGVPVTTSQRDQRPGDSLPNHARLYMWVADDVAAIVVLENERMSNGRTVEDKRCYCQQKTNCKVTLSGRPKQRAPDTGPNRNLSCHGELPSVVLQFVA